MATARRIRAWVAAALGSLALLCALSTLGSGSPWLSTPKLVGVLFALTFPIVGWVIIDKPRQLDRRDLPPWQVCLAAAAIAVVLLALGGSSLASLRGAPHEDNGQYYSNNHGIYTSLTREEYLHAKALEQRGFASATAIFYLGALFFTLTDLRRTRRESAPLAASRRGLWR